MASRKQFKLPPLKLTVRSTSGKTILKSVKRGKFEVDLQRTAPGIVTHDDSSSDSSRDSSIAASGSQSYLPIEQEVHHGVSLHSIKQQSTASAWESIRSRLLHIDPLRLNRLTSQDHTHHFRAIAAAMLVYHA